MAITVTQIENLPAYTAGNILDSLNYAIIQIALSGQSYSLNGRTYTRANLESLKRIRDSIKAEVDAASSSSGRNTALADFSGQ